MPEWKRTGPEVYEKRAEYGDIIMDAQVHKGGNDLWTNFVRVYTRGRPKKCGAGFTGQKSIAVGHEPQQASFKEAKAAADRQWRLLMEKHVPKPSKN